MTPYPVRSLPQSMPNAFMRLGAAGRIPFRA